MTRYLIKVGLEVSVAVNGEECLDLFFSHPYGYFSLILCDLFMPVKGEFHWTNEETPQSSVY